jgi:hypothetical protein
VKAVSKWGLGVMLVFAGACVAAPAASAAVVVNEINCDGTDWIELANTSATAADISGFVLTDAPLNGSGSPLTVPNSTTIAGNGHLAFVRSQPGSFTFGISCSDTIRLGDPGLALVDQETLPNIDFDLDSWGRFPDATGGFRQTFPTQGTPNQPSPSGVDMASEIFNPTEVANLELGLPVASRNALDADPTTYVAGTITLTTSSTTYGPLNVGIRLKGSGSFRTLAAKAAFKVKMPFSVPGQRLAGLRKLTLNNMVQDPSMVHELLAYRAFRAMGLTAPRTGYAKVAVNGTDYGLYMNVETFDDVFLAGLPSTQHLYEGELGDDTTSSAIGGFEIDEGTESSISDLEALAAAVEGGIPADFSDRVAGFADLQQMARMWATQKYMGDWDGYAGFLDSIHPNNYYLHSDDSGLFTMLPTGTDQTWHERLELGTGDFDTGSGIMFQKCLADPSCAALYRQDVIDARSTIAGLNLDELAVTTAAFLEPFQTSAREEYTPEQIAQDVSATLDFIRSRPGDVSTWLDKVPPDPGIQNPTDPGLQNPTSSSLGASKTSKKKCKRTKKAAAKSRKCHKRKSRT